MKLRKRKKKLMDFRENKTGINQLFRFKHDSSPAVVIPKAFIDVTLLDGGYHEALTKGKSFIETMQRLGIADFYLERSFSLGDTLMLVPIIRRLRQLNYTPYIKTVAQYKEILELLDMEVDVMGTNKAVVFISDPGILLDNIVEKDHYVESMHKMHRVNIYNKALGLSANYTPDWSMDLEKLPENLAKFDKYIAIQGIGNSPSRRGLSVDVIQDMIYFLNLEKVNVVYIGGKVDIKGDDEFTDFRFIDQTIPELFSIISGAELVISMDSSPIWVSHFTRTPLLAILGPSRASERLSMHPLLKTDVRALELNKWIGCESCFEGAKECKGEVTCFTKVTSEKLYEELRPIIMKYWGNIS